MTQVFLSHSTIDAEFALRLASDLRAAGVPVWKAPESILDGEEWVAAIERGLTTSTHFLLVQSPAAVKSKWVKFEFNAALTLEKQGRMHIIPVNYQPCKPPLFWTQFQQVSGIGDEYDAILSRILARLREEQPPNPPPPTLPSTTITVTGHGVVAEGSITYAGQPTEPPTTVVEPQLEPEQESYVRVKVVEPEPEPEIERLEFEPEVILIPAGPFLMGSPKSDKLRFDQEPEQFELNLDYDYAIGKYPVTVDQYRAFVDAGGYANPVYWTSAGWQWRISEKRTQPDYWTDKKWTGDNLLPVVGVSWCEVYAYTRWLAEATGRDYRLPTEAEWEKAARGGFQLPDGKGGWKKNPNPARLWPWGDEQPDDKRLNFSRNVGHTTPVGQYRQGVSPYGAFDMAGNVWEWCLSAWAVPYTHPEQNDPQGDSPRVLRGGSFYYDQRRCRASVRNYLNLPNDRLDNLGFRVVVVPL